MLDNENEKQSINDKVFSVFFKIFIKFFFFIYIFINLYRISVVVVLEEQIEYNYQ